MDLTPKLYNISGPICIILCPIPISKTPVYTFIPDTISIVKISNFVPMNFDGKKVSLLNF